MKYNKLSFIYIIDFPRVYSLVKIRALQQPMGLPRGTMAVKPRGPLVRPLEPDPQSIQVHFLSEFAPF
jgi:hypothetical protein